MNEVFGKMKAAQLEVLKSLPLAHLVETVYEMAQIAFTQIGPKETQGNNTGADVLKYQKATWLQPGPWPWCAAFTSWCLMEWVLKDPTTRMWMIMGDAYFDNPYTQMAIPRLVCRDARAFGWEAWGRSAGLVMFDENSNIYQPIPGDIVIFDFSHIGIVDMPPDLTLPYKTIPTIEGNTHPQHGSKLALVGADDREGDGVWRRIRNVNLVRRFVRLIHQRVWDEAKI